MGQEPRSLKKKRPQDGCPGAWRCGGTPVEAATVRAWKIAAAGAIVALAGAATPSNAYERVQKLGPVEAHEPILTTIGNKHVIAFFIPCNGQCNVQAVLWNADDMEAKSAASVRTSLNPAQTLSIDSSPTETLILKCGDAAESLSAVDSDQQVSSR